MIEHVIEKDLTPETFADYVAEVTQYHIDNAPNGTKDLGSVSTVYDGFVYIESELENFE